MLTTFHPPPAPVPAPSLVQMQQPRSPEGIRELFLPHRYSAWGAGVDVTNLLHAKNQPFGPQSSPGHTAPPNLTWPGRDSQRPFPFETPYPGGVFSLRRLGSMDTPPTIPPALKFNRMHRAPLSTLPKSHTKLTKRVGETPIPQRLHLVKFSKRLWPAFAAYALGGDSLENDPLPNMRSPLQVPWQNENLPPHYNYLNTFRHPFGQLNPIPDATRQNKAISTLWWWFLCHLNTMDTIVTSEASVQDEVLHQLLFPMNTLLMVRS